MMSKFVSAVLISGLLFGAAAVPAEAAPKKAQYQSSAEDDGYAIHRRRKGGYSYDYSDSINTYGGNRRHHVGPPSFREQTISGPFDNSFFFDSAIGLHGGDSPYMN
jgi:hypothetical protein